MTAIHYGKVILAAILITSASCNKALDLRPQTDLDQAAALEGFDNLQSATNGVYSLYNNYQLLGAYYNLVELSTDNVEVLVPGNNATTASIESYSFRRTTTMFDLKTWDATYKTIYNANAVIGAINDNAAPELLQLKGECLFLRAFLHLDMVRAFGRPYVQGNGDNLGVPYMTSIDPLLLPSRNKVKEVYDMAETDLLHAAEWLTVQKSNAYAGREACWGALAALYLDKGNCQKAMEYANKVISSGRYSLVTGAAFTTYFGTDHSGSSDKETIFTLKSLDTQGKSYYGMGYSYTQTKYAAVSKPFLALLNEFDSDQRKTFYVKLPTTQAGERYFTNKFVQQGNPAVSSPALIRLAEMYLIRAEGNAKTGNPAAALDDVNLLRRRAGITTDGLYSLTNLHGRSSVLEVVLDESRLEFGFEHGRRRNDLLRNGLPVIRNYTGSTVPGSNITVAPTDKSVIYPIPASEISVNPNLEQNPL